MRVMRGKSFENDGIWEKLEIELDGSDLLPIEANAPLHVQPMLLELRAEQHLVTFMYRKGYYTMVEAKDVADEIKQRRKDLMGPSGS
jgi:hypothetical protein